MNSALNISIIFKQMRVITNIHTTVSAYYFDLDTKIYFVLLASERKSQRYVWKTCFDCSLTGKLKLLLLYSGSVFLIFHAIRDISLQDADHYILRTLTGDGKLTKNS